MSEPSEHRVSKSETLQDFDPAPTVFIDDTVPVTGPSGLARDVSAAGRVSAWVQSSSTMGRSLVQILVVLVVLLMLVNVPFKDENAGLAQQKPDVRSLVIRDGMMFQGSGPEIYLVDNHRLRRISGPEALAHFLGRGGQVTVVDDSVLVQFGQGPPIRRLFRCRDKPAAIYAVEDGHKYQIQDPPSTNKAKPWDRVEFVSCSYLNQLPTRPAPSAETDHVRTEIY